GPKNDKLPLPATLHANAPEALIGRVVPARPTAPAPISCPEASVTVALKALSEPTWNAMLLVATDQSAEPTFDMEILDVCKSGADTVVGALAAAATVTRRELAACATGGEACSNPW